MEDLGILKGIAEQGVFAGLFVYLFITTQKKNDAREERLNDIIDSFSEKFGEISEKVSDLTVKVEEQTKMNIRERRKLRIEIKEKEKEIDRYEQNREDEEENEE